MQHTIVTLVENKPGVLNRVTMLFRRRSFNIESLTVGHTEDPNVSRMTITVNTTEENAKRLIAYLYKLVNVIQVSDMTNANTITRSLAMIKVSANDQKRSEIMQLVDIYRARIVDVGSESLVVEITGTEDKIESLVDVMRPFGIIEMVRTGKIAMERGSKSLAHGPVQPSAAASA